MSALFIVRLPIASAVGERIPSARGDKTCKGGRAARAAMQPKLLWTPVSLTTDENQAINSI